MKTKRGIYLNIEDSDYYYDLDGIRYYFSSEFNLGRFKDRVLNYVNEESIKLKLRYKVNVNFDLFFTISYYRKIEKRGFKVVDLSNNRKITKETIILNTIV
jgi:YHS domain-containing protein